MTMMKRTWEKQLVVEQAVIEQVFSVSVAVIIGLGLVLAFAVLAVVNKMLRLE